MAGDWYCPAVIRQALLEHVPQGGVDVIVLSNRWKTPEDIGRIRETVAYLDEDRSLYPDHTAMKALVGSWKILAAVEAEVGDLAEG